MYVYERFKGILKSFVRNRAYPEGSVVQGYCIEEDMEWALNYVDPSNLIGVCFVALIFTLCNKYPDPHCFVALISTCCNRYLLCPST
jgi:hypothetical protein